jgi:hypothetical protein
VTIPERQLLPDVLSESHTLVAGVNCLQMALPVRAIWPYQSLNHRIALTLSLIQTKPPVVNSGGERARLRGLARGLGLAVAYAMAAALVMSTGVAAATGPSSPGGGNLPSVQSQLAGMSPALQASYKAKLKLYDAFVKANAQGGIQPNVCVPEGCVPNYYYEYMHTILEGGGDSWCGPATAEEMYSSYNYYWGTPYINQTQAYNEIVAGGYWHNGTDAPGIAYEMNKHQTLNGYVRQHITGAADVWNYSAVDIGGYKFPVAYDGYTDGYFVNPLYPNYVNVYWYHWFPAYGYNTGTMSVADSHFNANYTYSSTAIYDFIYNLFGGTNATVTW